MQINLIWIISHPEKISVGELLKYDKVFVASSLYTHKLKATGVLSAEELLQCTDISRFYNSENNGKNIVRNLFCANSRKILRTVVSLAIKEGVDLDIYGEMWEGLAQKNMIRGNKIDNIELPFYYQNSDVVLNDHWESMKNEGFISNRVFDVLACGAPLVTDRVLGMPQDLVEMSFFFEGDDTTLFFAIEAAKKSYSNNKEKHIHAARNIQKKHSFDNRVDKIIYVANSIIEDKINSTLQNQVSRNEYRI